MAKLTAFGKATHNGLHIYDLGTIQDLCRQNSGKRVVIDLHFIEGDGTVYQDTFYWRGCIEPAVAKLLEYGTETTAKQLSAELVAESPYLTEWETADRKERSQHIEYTIRWCAVNLGLVIHDRT